MKKHSKSIIVAIIVGLVFGLGLTVIPRQGRTIDFSNDCPPSNSTNPDSCIEMLQDTGYPFKVYIESPGEMIGAINRSEANNFALYLVLDLLIGFGLGFIATRVIIHTYKNRKTSK